MIRYLFSYCLPLTASEEMAQVHIQSCKMLTENVFAVKYMQSGREPQSSGYSRRLMLRRSWVQIPAPYGHFFTYICCKICNDICLIKTKNKRVKRQGLALFKKYMQTVRHKVAHATHPTCIFCTVRKRVLIHLFVVNTHQNNATPILMIYGSKSFQTNTYFGRQTFRTS